MLAALALILAGAAGQTSAAPMPFGPNLGYWQFLTRNDPPVTFSCRLTRKDAFLSGSCLGGGFKSDGIMYGEIDALDVHISIYFERWDDSEVSFDFAGAVTADGDKMSGIMLTSDGTRDEFVATPGVIPPDVAMPAVP